MCWKKILNWLMGEDEIINDDVFLNSSHKALLFGINNYPGSGNDLNGCLNDVDDFEKKLREYWPHFKIKKFKDAEVTTTRFINEVEKAIKSLAPGDVVAIFFDSCFSESATKNNFCKKRFFDQGLGRRKKFQKRIFRSGPMKWIAFGACQDNQSASDAFLDNRFNGAFMYYNLYVMTPGPTYKEHYNKICAFLPSRLFAQIPSLEGPEELLSEKLFEKPTLIIAYSGHGSYVNDTSGDEEDGMDETLYLYNGNLIDDKIGELLQQIPVLT